MNIAPAQDTESIQSVRIKDMPNSLRPREQLMRFGPEGMTSESLLAILLRTGTKGRNVLHVANDLIQRFHKLDAMSQASIKELCEIKGIGRDKAVTLKAAFTLARRIAWEIRQERPLMETPAQIDRVIRDDLASCSEERLLLLLLDTRLRLIRSEKLSEGTLDSVMMHPRQVFRPAIIANASAIALAHNHPSGDPSPSEADIRHTRDIIRAGQLLKIRVIDHVIIGHRKSAEDRGYVSLRELGYFYE